ncbi:hypothetical protein CHLRE_08g373407v5 [Chlamydomonas reinhardtii]|uniref:Uncharacterized protein n=1 Tax=Chlamydomonas reinhardtii TaxID=3055 RepID=A0A2K3DHG8_CHLRE|nr:uncharacterized protein CHLRE_08g373407v5 [Chlamydomonas reinhardtii]PNW79988.1 hypothetical protein CHLRE_08g373407v5 [Chlamydomonas reinhardtii]
MSNPKNQQAAIASAVDALARGQGAIAELLVIQNLPAGLRGCKQACITTAAQLDKLIGPGTAAALERDRVSKAFEELPPQQCVQGQAASLGTAQQLSFHRRGRAWADELVQLGVRRKPRSLHPRRPAGRFWMTSSSAMTSLETQQLQAMTSLETKQQQAMASLETKQLHCCRP